MGYPNKDKVLKILDTLDEKEKQGKIVSSKILPLAATAADRMKFKLCEAILKFKHAENLTNQDLANRLGINKSDVSRILHYHIESFTLDRLVNYLQALLIASELPYLNDYLNLQIEAFLDVDFEQEEKKEA